MSNYSFGPFAAVTKVPESADFWGSVPDADRPVWARYMLDHCPRFPGATAMNMIAAHVIEGGTGVPTDWQETAAELHSAGFTPIHYYLLADLLRDVRNENQLDEATRGHFFKEWYQERRPGFRLNAEAWKPWLERVGQGQAPRRALRHVLKGSDVPATGEVRREGGMMTVNL